jgi:signal transduction histidine kinase/ActR/RegA family two-component response regulator
VSSSERSADPGDGDVRIRLHGLLGLTSRLSEPMPADEVVRVVVDQAQMAVGAVTALMWTVEDPPTHAKLAGASGHGPGVWDRYARIPLEPWLPMGDAMLRCEPLFFESRADFGSRYQTAEKQPRVSEQFSELSYACLPLVVHGRAVGGVSLVFPHARTFDDDERMFLTVLAHHAAQALERATLFEREKKAQERLESLKQLTAALSSAVTPEEVARLATQVGTEALGVAAGAVWAADEQGDLRLLGCHGTREQFAESFGHITAISDLPAARAARERRALFNESEADVADQPAGVIDKMGRGAAFRAHCVLPLVREGRLLGVLVFGAAGPRRFAPAERAFTSTVAEHCADALARARLYEDARRAERRLQSILERLPVGIFVSRGQNSMLVFANDAVARIWRVDAFPSLGEERCRMLKVSYPDGRPMPTQESPVVRALRGEVVSAIEARIERQDGTPGWVQVSAAPVFRADGTVEMAVATVVDVTAEKEAWAAADVAGRAKDEFVAMLGHELRNPLAPIVTALDLMRMTGAGMLEQERAIIERQAQHLVRLVDDLLDVSRSARGGLRLERVPVELSVVITDAIEVAGPLFEERNQKLAVSVPAAGLVVHADRGRLAQVVTNLLTNAAKYTPVGGHVTLSARCDGEQITLEVADDGAGIAPDLLGRIFDPFTQGQQGLDRKQGGLGLGLAIARQLVVGHDGTIEARSEGPGRGTTMIVRLPCARGHAAKEATSRHVANAMPRYAASRVLIVDDNPDAAAILATAIAQAGHDVRTAGDAPSALRLVETFVPDVALLDIGLPVMDGYELAGLLRRIPSLSRTALVALTGYAGDGDRQRSLAGGFNEHFAKPLPLSRVLECIERLARRAD